MVVSGSDLGVDRQGSADDKGRAEGRDGQEGEDDGGATHVEDSSVVRGIRTKRVCE